MRKKGKAMSDATRTLQQILAQLIVERAELDSQADTIKRALLSLNGNPPKSSKLPKMSLARRRAISRRLKAHWAKRHREEAS